VLEDPAGRFVGRAAAADYMHDIFAAHPNLSLKLNRVHVAPPATTILEFQLTLGDKCLLGTDVIEWKDDRMVSLRAVLHEVPRSCNENHS
jgi:predicted TIM-barrel fold metal-dependent hydrolase